MYYRGANAAIIVFDLTASETLNAVKDWVQELRRNLQDEIIIAIVGNKVDLKEEKQVSKADALEYANSIHASYFEVSAKTGEGINEIFLVVAKALLASISPVTLPPNFSLERIDKPFHNEDAPSTPGCC